MVCEMVAHTQAYALSPTIAGITTVLVFAYVVMWIFPSPHVFSTVTNVCFLAAGFQRECVSIQHAHSASTVVGLLSASPLIYALLGASSLAFHATHTMGSAAHTADILLGWILALHVCYVCVSVSLLYWFSKEIAFVRPLLSGIFLASLVLVVLNYDTI